HGAGRDAGAQPVALREHDSARPLDGILRALRGGREVLGRARASGLPRREPGNRLEPRRGAAAGGVLRRRRAAARPGGRRRGSARGAVRLAGLDRGRLVCHVVGAVSDKSANDPPRGSLPVWPALGVLLIVVFAALYMGGAIKKVGLSELFV